MARSIEAVVSLVCFFFLIIFATEGARKDSEDWPTRCKSDGPPIRFPFRLKGSHPDYYGYPGFDLSCTGTNETMLELPDSVMLVVSKIDYKSQNLHVYIPTGCLSKQLRILNLSTSPFQLPYEDTSDYTFFNCSRESTWSTHYGFEVNCPGDSGHQIIALDSHEVPESLWSMISCIKMYNASSVPGYILYSKPDIILNWISPNCTSCEKKGKICSLNKNSSEPEIECLNSPNQHSGESTKIRVTGSVLGSFFLVLVVIALYRVYKSDKVEKENQLKIKKFLEDYKALKPTRYTYADIERITNEFKDELGQGGYGTVFKGKLSNEVLVAVKILNSSKGKGEEFINEVGTMCRIHHVNVVRLVGFCADGFRRALVYEYLPNDSLQKFISSVDDKSCFLGWRKLQDIALGIAKGIEYLHLGCDQRILHFDIKPHNVLLDHNFNPKISDFGLAKLCSKDQSIVSMTTARGTMGYIAPEVFSRNFGNVSYKSDVYSFGMLLLEIVGGRKNVDVTKENSGEIYFPEWIYNLLEQEQDLRIQIEEEGDAKIAKKLAIVGLWCIQWHPMDRPSMKIVVQMLDGEENSLTMPPNPFSSTSPSPKTSDASMPGRRRHQELEVISELHEELEVFSDIE